MVMWEVWTLGQQPYPGRPDNMEVFEYVRAGGQLEVPDRAPATLSDLMLRCWSYDPEERPNFAHSLRTIEEELEAKGVRGKHKTKSAYTWLNLKFP